MREKITVSKDNRTNTTGKDLEFEVEFCPVCGGVPDFYGRVTKNGLESVLQCKTGMSHVLTDFRLSREEAVENWNEKCQKYAGEENPVLAQLKDIFKNAGFGG